MRSRCLSKLALVVGLSLGLVSCSAIAGMSKSNVMISGGVARISTPSLDVSQPKAGNPEAAVRQLFDNWQKGNMALVYGLQSKQFIDEYPMQVFIGYSGFPANGKYLAIARPTNIRIIKVEPNASNNAKVYWEGDISIMSDPLSKGRSSAMSLPIKIKPGKTFSITYGAMQTDISSPLLVVKEGDNWRINNLFKFTQQQNEAK